MWGAELKTVDQVRMVSQTGIAVMGWIWFYQIGVTRTTCVWPAFEVLGVPVEHEAAEALCHAAYT